MPEAAGLVAIVREGSTGFQDHDRLLLSLHRLFDPARAVPEDENDEATEEDASWEPDQLDEWLATPPAGLIVDQLTEVTIAGAPATQSDTLPCQTGSSVKRPPEYASVPGHSNRSVVTKHRA